MIALTSIILSPCGQFAPLGSFLARQDWSFDRALDAEFKSCPIKGAALASVNELDEDPLEIIIHCREQAPIIGLGSTRIRMSGEEEQRWKRIDDLKVGDRVLLPERHGLWVVPTWSTVKRIRRSAELRAIWCNTPVVAGTLLLDGGESAGRSFITVSGIFLSKDDARG